MDDDDLAFKALADPTRRFLLDLLFARDGRTLGELEAEVEMTRFGVSKHLRVLEDAGLVVPRRSGREKLHFLNPVPIRLIHDRWIGKYTEQPVAALADLKRRLESNMTTTETGAEKTVQATLDLVRGLGLADLLTDDSARRTRLLAQWAVTLDQTLGR
ncbi:ArsR/SmtB family transcription factor [Actinomadura welshii]